MSGFCWQILPPLVVLLCCVVSVADSLPLSIGTCNMWNVMFNFEVRLQYVADMIQEYDLDVVVFQEVRMSYCQKTEHGVIVQCYSELDVLRRYLPPTYYWVFARPAGPAESSFIQQWNYEGLGFISRKPLLSADVIRLRRTGIADMNERIALNFRIQVGPSEQDVADIVVVHFSYDLQQQCDNANDIVRYIDGPNLKHPIVLGDFNVYERESAAIGQFVTLSKGHKQCPISNKDVLYKDAWLESGKSHFDGFSFSNMPTPGLQSRPDRILTGPKVDVMNTGFVDNGSTYWEHFRRKALNYRTWHVIKSGFYSLKGLTGYPCLHDCGPHGSCRCGICVKGGNSNNCMLPDCVECNSLKFTVFFVLMSIVVFAVISFLASVIRILVISARFNQNDVWDILGYRCCLFNKNLFQFKRNPFVGRKIVLQCVRLLKMYNDIPPCVMALTSIVLFLFAMCAINVVFHDTLYIINSVLAEEKFSSDHRMLYARLELK